MSLKKALKEVSDSGVVFKFSDGRILEANVPDFPPEMVPYLAALGLSHTIGDTYSGAESVAEAFEMASEKLASLLRGEKRSGTGGGPRATFLALALARVASKKLGREITEDEAKATIEAMSDEAKAKVRKDPAIQKEIQRIKLENLEKAEDAGESVLDGLFAQAAEAVGGKGGKNKAA